ncbi:TPA: hypothetical protein ACPVZG_004042 [Vibrio parahaemolyticus]|uniref:hypothetical protein n=1 Tax=Vibrio parahaemolyticus TaxID=670 RepID=UPI0032AFCA7E
MQNSITKTKGTKNDYIRRAILLQRKALNDFCLLFEKPPAHNIKSVKFEGKSVDTLDIKETVEFACEFWANTVSKHTWRYYRASLRHYAETLHESRKLSSTDLSLIIKLLKETNGSDLKYNRTSAQKKKYINDDELITLTEALDSSKSKYAKTLKGWLHANCLVGLRPCEWQNTEVVSKDGKIALMVINAKATNGRSHGKTRIIYLNHLPDRLRTLVINFSKHMRRLAEDGKYNDVYSGCRRLLQELNKRLWKQRKKNITLYSSRHQFSADLKKSGASLTDIAYLMGHYSTETATSHYGKRRYGKSIVKPQVDQELTTGIQKKFKPFKLGSNPKVKTPTQPPSVTPD